MYEDILTFLFLLCNIFIGGYGLATRQCLFPNVYADIINGPHGVRVVDSFMNGVEAIWGPVEIQSCGLERKVDLEDLPEVGPVSDSVIYL